MIVDLSGVASVALTLAGAAIAAAIPIVVPAVLRKIGLQNNAVAVSLITAAAQRGAGLAYSHLAANTASLANVDVRNEALAKGAQYVAQSFPELIAKYDVTPEHIQDMVGAELGKLVSADPTATITPPAGAKT